MTMHHHPLVVVDHTKEVEQVVVVVVAVTLVIGYESKHVVAQSEQGVVATLLLELSLNLTSPAEVSRLLEATSDRMVRQQNLACPPPPRMQDSGTILVQ